jgi:uncharacterized membrane protein
MRSTRIRMFIAYAGALVVAAALGSIAQTQFNMDAIERLGVHVPAATRLAVTLEDLWRFAPLYAVVVAVGFLLAFVVAGLLVRRMPGWRVPLFMLAGGVAIACAIVLINALLPVTPIAATRQAAGTLALALAGAVGGWVYVALSGRAG